MNDLNLLEKEHLISIIANMDFAVKEVFGKDGWEKVFGFEQKDSEFLSEVGHECSMFVLGKLDDLAKHQ